VNANGVIAWHIVTSEYPPDVGGVSDYTRQVAEGLARAGEDVHVWCPRPADSHAGVRIHAELGAITPSDLKRIDPQLDAHPAPRRLLVQWVPHGFGYHSMNIGFCLWLSRRARAGDIVELMVHEAYSDFKFGPLRHVAMACVQRFMTILLLQTASRVWIATPAWERRLRAYALGRRIAMTWLPVPGCVPPRAGSAAAVVRRQYADGDAPLIGHFGSFGKDVSALLEERLLSIMDHPLGPSLLLLGSGSLAYRDGLRERHPEWAGRVHATGYLPAHQLSDHIAACDLFAQPYPDGITSRRTTAMACLSQGRPVVTTAGPSTETLWTESGAVALASVADRVGFVTAVERLLEDPRKRASLGARGQALYLRSFDVGHIVESLRAA
jgi:glycosyltransferase involved in cell wall biosynthesis